MSYIRASICPVTALALKYGKVLFSDVGGCSFTTRPIDRHIELIKSFGILIEQEPSGFVAIRKDVPACVDFDCSTRFGPSVGLTCHALIAALQFSGEIRLSNIALEPAVQTLIEFIRFASGRSILINGRNLLIESEGQRNHEQVEITLPPDLTNAFTYIAAGISSGGLTTVQKR